MSVRAYKPARYSANNGSAEGNEHFKNKYNTLALFHRMLRIYCVPNKYRTRNVYLTIEKHSVKESMLKKM